MNQRYLMYGVLAKDIAISVAVYVANRNQQVILSRPSRSIETGWLLHFCSINKDAKPGINAIGTKLCIFNRIPTFASWTSSVRSSLPALDVGSSLLRPFKSRSSSGLNSRGNQYDFGACSRTYSPIYHFRQVAGTRCTKTITA